MTQSKPIMPMRNFNLPLYSLSEEDPRQKSCFVDNNRTDTVKPAITNKKQYNENYKLPVVDEDDS